MAARRRVKDEPEETEQETLAKAIRAISASMKKLAKSGLNRRAIVTLVYDDTKISKRTIVQIFDSLDELADLYTE